LANAAAIAPNISREQCMGSLRLELIAAAESAERDNVKAATGSIERVLRARRFL
jgi:hypothetical protein